MHALVILARVLESVVIAGVLATGWALLTWLRGPPGDEPPR